MMNLDYTVIQSIIKDLDKSINEHIIAKDLFNTDCQCHTPIQIGKCFICRVQEVIDDLSCLKSHLKPIAKNTINSIQFIDVESFCCTLGKQSNIDSIEIKPTWNFKNDDWNPDDDENKPIGYDIFVKYSRYTMDGNGYHVGYENVTFIWKAISKRELGITGIPYLLSSWVVNPDEFEIHLKDLPANDIPEHDPDCIYKAEDFANCDCADSFEGYFRPEDDFFYQEINNTLEQCEWIEAEFNSDEREWTLGNVSYNLNEFENEPDYKESCIEDGGRPSFGN
jgi:hypothetical protein